LVLAMVGASAGAALGGAASEAVGAVGARVPAAGLGALVGGVLACLLLGARLARALPDALDGWFARRRILHVVWIVAAILGAANLARVGVFAAAPDAQWASAFPPVPETANHSCLAAYVRAGDLARHGVDVWNPTHYENEPMRERSTIDGLQPWLGDAWEYPPPALILPRAAIAVTNRYQLIRDLWFAASVIAFFAAYVALALYAGNATALILAPLFGLAFPLLFGLQWGQAHGVVLAASIGAMVLFARGRDAAGGALLAIAISTKIFPGLLLVHLAMRRRWRAVIATCVALGVLVGLSWIVVGGNVWYGFVREQLPRMSSGAAFGTMPYNIDNLAPYGWPLKLQTLGIGDGSFASTAAWLWTLVAIALTVLGSRGPADRRRDSIVWLGILAAGALRSPYAPIYTAVGSLLVLAFAMPARPARRAQAIVCWILLQGVPPLGGQVAMVYATIPMILVSVGLAISGCLPRRADDSARTASPSA
jgi:hypothetical protein